MKIHSHFCETESRPPERISSIDYISEYISEHMTCVIQRCLILSFIFASIFIITGPSLSREINPDTVYKAVYRTEVLDEETRTIYLTTIYKNKEIMRFEQEWQGRKIIMLALLPINKFYLLHPDLKKYDEILPTDHIKRVLFSRTLAPEEILAASKTKGESIFTSEISSRNRILVSTRILDRTGSYISQVKYILDRDGALVSSDRYIHTGKRTPVLVERTFRVHKSKEKFHSSLFTIPDDYETY